jgi:predicted PolB exonuclease-like 3'-5' exonuclease
MSLIIRAFDIETVPDLSVWTPPENPDPAKPPPFPPPHAHKVQAIAWVDLDGTPRAERRLAVSSPPTAEHRYAALSFGSLVAREMIGESDLIAAFGISCSKVLSDGHQLMFVSWNGRRFDGPVLALRAMKHEIPWAWWWTADPSYRYRYSESQGHVDMMDVLADFGAAPAAKMGDMARLCGMPGKPDMHGDSVAAELEKGNHKKVADYCLLDAVQTAGIYVRHQFQKGVITKPNLTFALRELERVIDHRYPLVSP